MPNVKRKVAIGWRMNGAEIDTASGLRLRERSASRRLLILRQPARHPAEGEVDDRRRVERQELRDGEAADDGDAERLAQLGAGAALEGERQRAEQRRHR